MDEVRDLVIARLKGDNPTLYPSLLSGGVYNRKLAVTGAGATDEAFYVQPNDLIKRVRLRESLVIFGPNNVSGTDGAIQTGGIQTRQGYLRMYLYVPATDDGREHFDQIEARIFYLLEGWQAQLSTNYPVTVEHVDTTEPIDSDEFDGALVGIIRYRAEWSRTAP